MLRVSGPAAYGRVPLLGEHEQVWGFTDASEQIALDFSTRGPKPQTIEMFEEGKRTARP